MSDYLEVWRDDVANEPDDALRLRLLVRDAGAPSATDLGGLEIHLVGPGEAPQPESGVWVPPAARAAFLAWCRTLPDAPASPLEPGAPARSSDKGRIDTAPNKGDERGRDNVRTAGRLDFAKRQREKEASRAQDAEDNKHSAL